MGLWIALILGAMLAAPAHAEDAVLPPDEAAMKASQVQADHCADVLAADPETQAAAMQAASPVYGQVAAAYRVHGEGYLLFWRGLLAECLNNHEQAVADYKKFVHELESDSTYAPQIADARRRLRRLLPESERRAYSAQAPMALPGAIVAASGGVLGAVGGVMTGTSWSSAELELDRNVFVGTNEEYQQALAVNHGGFGLLVGGASAAVVGTIAALVASRNTSVAAVVVPTRDGVALAIGGSW
jgi:hypothetical protein